MKKVRVLLILTAVVAVFTFGSCKKDRTCSCTYTSGGSSYTEAHDLYKTTSKTAQGACDALQLVNAGGVCTLQ